MHRHTEHWTNRQKNSMQLNAVAYRGSKQTQDFGMNKFYIITNSEKDKNLEFTDRVVDYLGKRGGHCEVQLAGRQDGRSVPLYGLQERSRKKHSALSYLAVMEPFFRLPETFRRLTIRSAVRFPFWESILEIWAFWLRWTGSLYTRLLTSLRRMSTRWKRE